MGKYDDIRPEDLRADLVRFARLILRLEENDLLLRSVPELQRLIGELRQKLFAYEVRGTRRLELPGKKEREAPTEESEADPSLRESLRVVREAIERERKLKDEWEGRAPAEDEDDEADE